MTALCGLLSSTMAATLSPPYSEGVEYSRARTPVADLPPVVEFFTFHCPACYLMETRLGVPAALDAVLPPGQPVVKYHLAMMGPLGPALTRAWSVALLLGVTDRVTPALFAAMQDAQTLNTPSDIRRVFIEAGVAAERYDATLVSEQARLLTGKQTEAALTLRILRAPTFVVNGSLRLNGGALLEGVTCEQAVAERYADLVCWLRARPPAVRRRRWRRTFRALRAHQRNRH
jgi:thiol:disulfide interchange protein DsbA